MAGCPNIKQNQFETGGSIEEKKGKDSVQKDIIQSGTYLIAKRALDLLVAFLIVILVLPLIPVIVLLIKMDSRGPVLFRQKRVGKKGKIFDLYKFRSMVDGAEKALDSLRPLSNREGPIFKIEEDPRITRVGRFLRRSSLDELPQILNVLKGDMSLVGPRPPTPDEVEKYEGDL